MVATVGPSGRVKRRTTPLVRSAMTMEYRLDVTALLGRLPRGAARLDSVETGNSTTRAAPTGK